MKWRLQLVVFGSFCLVCSGFLSPPQIRQRCILPALLLKQGDASYSDVAATIRKCNTVTHVLEMMMETDEPNSNAAALRRLSDLMTSCRSRRQRLSDCDQTLAQEKVLVLLENLDDAVDNDSEELNIHALVDILTALPKLTTTHDSNKRTSLASRICVLLDESEQHDLIKHVKPNRLVECLQALAALELYHSSLIGRICHRLQQGDALAMVDPRHLAIGIKAMVPLEHVHEHVSTTLRAFMRRWRKQGVRKSATTTDICQALYAARLLTQEHPAHANDTETSTMVYTLLRELHCPSPNTTVPRSLTAGQVAEALLTASAFQVNATNPVFDHFMETLAQERTMERATIPDVARILLSMERLHISHYPSVVQRLGQRFLSLVEESVVMEPKSVCNILRSALRLHQRNDQVMEPFVNVSRHLIVHTSFIQHCSDMDLSSLVRFLCLVRCNDEQVLSSLAERILEPDIVEECTPKAASQILAYFTMWIHASTDELLEMRSLLSEMFHELGTHLLSTQLASAETSASMQAYAKASYVQDMGIFDHLACHLTSLLDDCSIRQVVQALWACGKMRLWEADHVEQEDQSGPPYLEAAREYTAFLASRASHLNSKDISQSLWALGRLGIDDANVISALALRARDAAPELTSRELSTILWGLSRVGCDDREAIKTLTNRMLELQPSSQEAATVLYALGLMGIKDEVVFSSMSNAMMDQLETASAQAIANALWAYRTVEIPPPRELMDSWVIQKLGLDSVTMNPIEDL